MLLDGLAIRQLEGHTAAAPALARALQGILALNAGTDIDVGRWLWLAGLRAAGLVANELWDDDARHTLAVRQVEVARSAARSSSCSTRSTSWPGPASTPAR